MLDTDLKEKLIRLFDRTSDEAIAILVAQPETERAAPEPLADWMTATQLARYWQLIKCGGGAHDRRNYEVGEALR